jgi:hypothetical protein
MSGMSGVELSDGSGWVNLTGAKRFNGLGEELYRTLSGAWIRKSPGPDARERYERVTLEQAHAWLVGHGYYPRLEPRLHDGAVDTAENKNRGWES